MKPKTKYLTSVKKKDFEIMKQVIADEQSRSFYKYTIEDLGDDWLYIYENEYN